MPARRGRMADADAEADGGERPALYAACLGRMGQFGNQVFQYAFALAYARTWSLMLRTPEWIGTHAFRDAAQYASGPLAPAPSRVLLADRVVIAHAGWKIWARKREPLATAGRERGQKLSGREVRRACPQVNAAAIARDERAVRASSCAEAVDACCARAGTLELWGFFQHHTAHFAPHAAMLRGAFATAAPVQALVNAALEQVRAEAAGGAGCATTLVCVHLRCHGDVAPAATEGGVGGARAYQGGTGGAGADVSWRRADAPAAEACSDGSEALPSEWRDEGVFWAAPALWYSTWLREIWPALERCAEIGPRSARDRPEISAPRAAQSGSHPLH